jgi:D-3-phosphoglycerate dehydrogenase
MSWVGNYNVLVTARSFGKNGSEAVNLLEQHGFTVTRGGGDRPLTSAELALLVVEADALIAGNDQVDAEVIEAGNKLKIISRYGVGVDNVDLAAATAKGIPVTNTPGTNEQSVADLVFGLMLAAARQIPTVVEHVRTGGWNRRLGTEVWGKTLGIIGFGKIGRGVAHRSKGFDMRVLVHDVCVDENAENEFGVTFVSREEVIRQADFLSLHTPCTPETRNMICAAQLEMMKPSAILINTARGGLIDEKALVEAIRNKAIAGTALDVLEHEPPKNRELLELDNVLITSHIGGYTTEAINAMSMLAAENVIQGLAGNFLELAVNPEVYRG